MPKFCYAVKRGNIPGIYTSWSECQKQVKGFKGAKFKGFDNPFKAEEWMNSKEEIIEDKQTNIDFSDYEIIAYVDGSINTKTKEYGWGAILLIGNEEIEMCGKGNKEHMLPLRNVAGEILSSVKAIEYAIDNEFNKLLIVHDYNGISKWAKNEWKANKEATNNYKLFCQEAMQKIDIDFMKVKGHTGDKYNDIADKLAKQGCGVI